MLEVPAVAALVNRIRSNAAVAALLPDRAVAVQCTLFTKDSASNWLVTLHQDLGIPVAERVDSPACQGWSMKEGVLYTQPPTSVLEGMVAVRLQLDESDAQAGALRVVPGSHRFGRLDAGAAAELRMRDGLETCVVPQGGVLAMRPLLLHASGKSESSGPRRVLHFLFGSPELPCGLRWAMAV